MDVVSSLRMAHIKTAHQNRYIHGRRLGVFAVDERRQQGNDNATTGHSVMSATSMRLDTGGPGKVLEAPGMHGLLPLYALGMDTAWLGDAISRSGAEWIEFGSANCHG